jgi:hypothetical protein
VKLRANGKGERPTSNVQRSTFKGGGEGLIRLRGGYGGRVSKGGNCGTTAFTLLEVMVAVFIFFVAVFAILDLMSQNLRLARSLQSNSPSASMVAGRLSLTNKLEEGSSSGDFEGYYPGYSWRSETSIAGTNGLFQIDIAVYKESLPFSTMSVLLYRPDSVQGAGVRGFGGQGRLR